MTSIAEALRISFLDLDPVFYAVNYADQDVLQFVKDVQFKRAIIYWREKKTRPKCVSTADPHTNRRNAISIHFEMLCKEKDKLKSLKKKQVENHNVKSYGLFPNRYPIVCELFIKIS